MDKTTTKARIVFHCAAKCNGISLNDMIYAGPKLPLAAETVLKSTYMDDSVDSVENDEDLEGASGVVASSIESAVGNC